MRKKKAVIRAIQPDSVYGNVMLSKFINRIMMGGKKSIARRSVYTALEMLGRTTNQPPLEAFETAVRKVMPSFEVRSRRVGGATYQVPTDVRPSRREALAQRWLIQAFRARKGMPLANKIYQELLDAYRGTGVAVKRREDTHRMAEANRAFVHYRW